MNQKQSWYFRAATTAILLLAAVSFLLIRNTGVLEVHRAGDPENFALVDPKPAQGDWPWWRGVDATNTAAFANPPVNWSLSENSGWHVAVPGRDHASPCIWGERIFLTTTDADRKAISLLCLDRDSGRSEWQTDLHRGGSVQFSAKNAYPASTPASDGRLVFVPSSIDGKLLVTAVDFAGQIAWQRNAGPHFTKRGYSSSPTIYKSLVIVAADSKGARIDRLMGASHLTALHRHTGRIVWRIRRPAADSFGSPIVAHVAGRDQLLLPGKGAVTSYDPATGDVLWTCRWSADWAANSVAFDGEHVFASARHPRSELICIRANGHGDVTDTHLVWRETTSACEIPSPVVFQGRILTLADDGMLVSLEAATGKTIWKRQLKGSFSTTPLIVGQNLFCCNEEGMTYAIKLGARGEIVGENRISAGIFASPVASHNRLFVRTLTGLHCVASPETTPTANRPEETKRRL